MTILILGPPAAGKTTIANMLAKEFEKSAVIHVDDIRSMIRGGYISPGRENEESEKQLRLSVENACVLASNLAKHDFNVIIDDVLTAKRRLDMYFEDIHDDVVAFLLLPKIETALERDKKRPAKAQMGERIKVLHKKITKRAKSETRWHVIDSSNQTEKETLQIILEKIKSQH